MIRLVGDRSGSRLVDDAHHIKPRQFSGFNGGLTLMVAKKGGNRYHRLFHRATEMRFRMFFQLRQNQRRYLFR